MTAYLLRRALLPDGVADDVLVRIHDGRFTEVARRWWSAGDEERGAGTSAPHTRGMSRAGPPGPERVETVPGLTVPGLANTHSHAFHRALRGRTQAERGSFWSWREQMYDAAERLDPDSYLELATATYREMVAAGITCVGEFHYLHHRPDGTPYEEPNVMGEALLEAARAAGLRITLLDACYLSAGFSEPVTPRQRRFSDGTAEAWAQRVDALHGSDVALPAAAIHSVRAVPSEQLPTVAAWAREAGVPLHVHLSEQRRENEDCVAAYDRTPTRLLAEAGALGPRTTVVHATHLADDDLATLGSAGVYAAFCPTTEADLGDGIGPGHRLHEAGARLTLGSDSHAVVDPFAEMRALELHERLAVERRGHWSAGELLAAATRVGHESLGWADAGEIAVGRRADLVTLDTVSPRTAGTGADEQTAVFAASAADVVQVIADGRVVFSDGERHEIGRALDRAVGRMWA